MCPAADPGLGEGGWVGCLCMGVWKGGCSGEVIFIFLMKRGRTTYPRPPEPVPGALAVVALTFQTCGGTGNGVSCLSMERRTGGGQCDRRPHVPHLSVVCTWCSDSVVV